MYGYFFMMAILYFLFTSSYGQFDWDQMYGGKSGYDYPGGFENTSLSASNESDIDYYKNKYIINQKGGTIEFVNSDYHYL